MENSMVADNIFELAVKNSAIRKIEFFILWPAKFKQEGVNSNL